MSVDATIHVGDWGTKLRVNCVNDISSATTRSIELRKPDGSVTSLVAIAESATEISAIAHAGLFTVAGGWRLRAAIGTAVGEWFGDGVGFVVYPDFG